MQSLNNVATNLPMGDAMQDFRRLHVWKKAHEEVLSVYRVTRQFPIEERFGLTSQMRRCAISIPANLAEGCGRQQGPDSARFYQVAMGSASELEYYVLLAYGLEFLDEAAHAKLLANVTEIKRMLPSLIRKTRAAATTAR